MLGRLAVLPSKVRAQVMSTTPWRSSTRRAHLRTLHQEEQVSVSHTIPLMRSQRPCLREWLTTLALEDWLRRCSSSREGKCHPCMSLSLSKRKLHVTLTTPKYRETCCETLAEKRNSSRDWESSQERQLVNQRIRAERWEVRDLFRSREQEALHAAAQLQVSYMESHTRVPLEEQRSQLISQARYEFCRRRSLRTQYKICRNNLVLKMLSFITEVESIMFHNRNNL